MTLTDYAAARDARQHRAILARAQDRAATFHPSGCWRCPSPVPYGSHPTMHTPTTASCGARYIGSDDAAHICTRPIGHDAGHRAGDYR